jgi:hypothetical protein
MAVSNLLSFNRWLRDELDKHCFYGFLLNCYLLNKYLNIGGRFFASPLPMIIAIPHVNATKKHLPGMKSIQFPFRPYGDVVKCHAVVCGTVSTIACTYN